ncbi:MAG: hypothetical protein HZB41_02370 [Ignavibacteriae bacterium]|nr:hypothetical protein [Ignavibacteriota bacterium]
MFFKGLHKKEEIVIFSSDRDENLEEIYDYIKNISKIENKTKALEEVEKLVQLIIDKHTEYTEIQDNDKKNDTEYELENAKQDINLLINILKDLERHIEEKNVEDYEIDNIENRIGELDIYWSKNIQKLFYDEVKELKDYGNNLLRKAIIEFHLNNINNSLTDSIPSISSVERIIRTLTEAEEFFIKNNMINDDLQNKIRKGKERSAWSRARKKLNEAEVAEAGQNIKKTEKLRAEAKVLIKQDWKLVFPNEEPPNIIV